MRRFVDDEGSSWDVVLGRESWGALLALFVPVSGAHPVRQTMLHAAAYDAAMHELDSMDDVALRSLLDRSVPKEEGL